jgi:4-aminobutyrate aminotransferase
MSNSTIDARRVAAISCGVGFATQIYAVRAENAEIWDADDKRYIDFGAGVAVVNTGHRHPKVVAAVKAQLDRFTHTCHQVVPYENYVHLAERLNEIVPGEFSKKTISSRPARKRRRMPSRSLAPPQIARLLSPSPAAFMAAHT